MRNFHKIILTVFTLIFALSISVANAQECSSCPVSYKVTPKVLQSIGGIVSYQITVTFPGRYLNRRAAFDVKPVYKYKGEELVLPTQTFIGEKIEGINGIVVPYVKGGSFSFSGSFKFHPEMSVGVLVVNPPKVYVPNLCNVIEYNSSCECPSGIKIADGINHTVELAGGNEELLSIEIQQNVELTETAKIFFPVGSYIYNKDFSLNTSAEAINSREALVNFLAQGLVIKKIDINAYASPEGLTNSGNTKLSENRANAAAQYLRGEMQKLIDAPGSKMKIKDVNSLTFNRNREIPDWNGFILKVENSDLAAKSTIVSQLKSDNREAQLKLLLVKYPTLKGFLPSLRRAEIVATCFEDERTVDTWETQTITSLTDIQNKEYARAIINLKKANELSPDNVTILNNLGAAYARNGEWENAKTAFTKAQALGANEDYNLGIVAIQFGEYDKALSLLGSRKCEVNIGLAQLMTGKYADAKANLSCAEQTFKTNYLLAIIGARTSNDEEVFTGLRKAIELNPMLKVKAMNDIEFVRYFNNVEFLAIVN